MARIGRILQSGDTLFATHGLPANATRLVRYASDDDYLRLAVPDVDCAATPPQPTPSERDSFTEPYRWLGSSPPTHENGAGWRFRYNHHLYTSYTCYPWGAFTLRAYADTSALPPWRTASQPTDPLCSSESREEGILSSIIEGLLIEYGEVGIGVGYRHARCCDIPQEYNFRCLLVKNGEVLETAFPAASGNLVAMELDYTGDTVYWRFVIGGDTYEFSQYRTLTPTRIDLRWLRSQSGGCPPEPEPDASVLLQQITSLPEKTYRFESNALLLSEPGRLRARLITPATPSRVQFKAGTGAWQDAIETNGTYRLASDPEANEWRIAIETAALLDRIDYWTVPSGNGVLEYTITPYLLLPNRYIARYKLAYFNPDNPPTLPFNLRVLSASDRITIMQNRLILSDEFELYEPPRLLYLLCDSV
jgi:hypothetical protein